MDVPPVVPENSPTTDIKSLLLIDFSLGCVFAIVSMFSKNGAGISCIVVGATRIRDAITKETVRWDGGSDEMPNGRLIVVGIAVVWILCGLYFIVTS
jgi:hypothetical protein